MRGFPPPPEKRPGPSNWDLAPFNRWSFMNIRNLFPTVVSLAEFLHASYTDGFLVLHRGKIVHEEYFNNMQSDTAHLSQSVAKSIVGALTGILHARGLVDPNAPLIDYVPELARCGYRGATLVHALDMTSGIRFVEDYGRPDSDMTRIDIASGWRPPPDGEAQSTIRDVILSLPKQRAHGEVFEYKSIETDVVAWALERAANRSLADLVSEHIWKKIGAEHNAFFTVDRAATALADGGFGLMMQNDGKVGDVEVVPGDWVDACASGNRDVYGEPYTETCPDGAYSNFWWCNNIEAGDFMARGVFGQMIYINRAAQLTIVKLSTWPDYQIRNFTRDSLRAFAEILRQLA